MFLKVYPRFTPGVILNHILRYKICTHEADYTKFAENCVRGFEKRNKKNIDPVIVRSKRPLVYSTLRWVISTLKEYEIWEFSNQNGDIL